MDFSRNTESVFPALGAGKSMEDENQLIQAPEEEEDFDILNDETFGNCGGDIDYNWEDEHNRMAEELEGSAFFETEHVENKTRDSGFATMDRGYSTTTQEDELEQSINRLMVDDHDSKAFTANGQPIPGAQRRSHLEALFNGPGYMDLETLSSPGKNIWGSPSGDSPFEKPVNNTLQALFASVKQAGAGAGAGDFPGLFQDAKSMRGPAVPLPAEAPTLAEIEHNMMAREQHKPRVLTAEEVERQLRGEPPLPSEPRRHYAIPEQLPPVGTSVTFRRPSNQGPLNIGSMGQSVPGQSSPINISSQRGQQVPGIHANQDSSVISIGRSPSPSHLPPGIPPNMMAHSPRMMSPYNPAAVFMANQLLGNAMTRPPPPHPPTHVLPPNVNVSSPFGSPYGSPSTAVMAPRIPHVPLPMLDQQSPPNRPRMAMPSGLPHPPNANHMQNSPLPPHLPPQHHQASHPGDRPSQWPGHSVGGQGYHSDPRELHNFHHNNSYRNNHHHHHQRSYNDNSNLNPSEAEDDYAGLMSKKEKDWIIKIQLIQLQTENPYLDDYYYTYYTIKKKAASTSNQSDGTAVQGMKGLELLIPSMIKLEPRTYTPAQFEGSLGRLTAASVHNPRQIIDVCRNVSPTNEESAQNVSKELRRYRQLLMDIEKGYNVILDVDDIEKKVLALPDENRLPLFEERREKIQIVYDYFMQDDSLKNFVPTLSVRKGRKLLARLMPLLDKGLFVLMRPLSHFLAQCNLECLVHFATILQKHPEQNVEGLTLLLHNTFGVTLLCFLLKVGEEIFKSTIDLDNQLKTQWTNFMEEFVENLEVMPLEKLAWPATPQPSVGEHMERFINNKQMVSIEEKIAHLSKPRPKEEQQDARNNHQHHRAGQPLETGRKLAMMAS